MDAKPEMYPLDIVALEGETAIVFPAEMLKRLGAVEGDILRAVETPDGYLLTRDQPAAGLASLPRS